MNDQKDILSTLARHLILALEPIREAFSDTESFKGFLYRMGWSADDLPPAYVELASAVADGVAQIEQLREGPLELSEITALLSKSKSLYDKIRALSVAPPGVNAPVFLGEIRERLFELLLTEYLSRNQATLFSLFAALDVIQIENLDATADKLASVRTHFRWAEIPAVLSDPLSIAQRVYGWGTPELNARDVFAHLSGFLFGFGLPVNLLKVADDLAEEYAETEELLFTRQARGLKIPFYYGVLADQVIELSLELLELPASSGKLPGLVLQPGIPAEIPLTFRLGDEVDLHVRAGSDIGSRFGVLIRPDGLAIKYPFQDSASFPAAGFSVNLDYHPPQPRALFGSPGGIRMEMQGASLGLEVISAGGEVEVRGLSEIKKLALILAAGSGDGFLQKILGDRETRVDIPLGVDWSSKTGFGFRGSMNFEIALNPHLSLGPIDVTQFQLSLGVPPDPKPKLKVEAGINIKGDLGPIKFVVEEIGMGLYATFESGNLGPLDLTAGFKPPAGVGLSVDAGVVKGGGYLYFNSEKEEYAGALELVFSGFINLKAIGLLTTRMPDGSKGFSLLIIITAEFGTGIQLGFGFTLLAVGGLLGLNRTMRLQALMDGVRTGAINSLMFPRDVIANAPRIISDLRAFFPPENGKFLIGPMAKLGWGTPPLISISLGVIIEIPGNIAIVGVLRVALPTDDAALIVLQVNFAGAIEFDKKRLYFFAALFESRVLYMTIEGEMGLLAAFGDDANFVAVIGGFHPRFNPPPLPFPSPRRIEVSLINESNARIRTTSYYAVTSNTAQFGAHAELFFGFSAFSVQGHLGFDALLQFSPLYFIIEISSSVSLKAFGVGVFSLRLRFALEGPQPWRARGRGSISLLFFSISANFDVTWGEPAGPGLPPIAVMTLVKTEFEKAENWRALLPAGANLLVSLRKIEPAEAALVLHPVGVLRISQKAVPLNLTFDKIGNQKPSDARHVSLSVAGGGLGKAADRLESFALAQFQEMDDAAKLSLPPYQPLQGGVDLSVQGMQLGSGKMARRRVRYEEIIIDSNYKRFARRFATFFSALFAHFLRGSAITKSTLSNHQRQQVRPFADKVTVHPETFAVAFNHNNHAYSDEAATFTSEAMARAFMQQQIAEDPGLSEALHVIPQYEVNRAA